MSQPKRLRRCQLSVPGSSEKMMQKAAGLDLDYVFLDLEDAVAPSAKHEARGKIVGALNDLDWGRTTRCVRINDLTTEYAYEDIIEVVEGAGENIDVIMLTKCLGPDDITFCDKLLSMMEKKLKLNKRIGLETLIEEVEAMQKVDEIAAASDRLEALIFGMGDYSASQGVSINDIGGDTGYPGDIWHYQRQKLTIAARANRIDAVDGPFADFRSPDTYREECRRAMILGMVGKWAIHPSQIEIAQDVFSPKAEDVARARKMKAAYEDAWSQGLGSVQFEGRMIDIASIRIVDNTLQKADMIGGYS
ncbi:HpcH/HpaI aldolase/citrate lyase family protein [Sulfitobacter dubius]|uniref:HpcH/HpaI aldolase/citrate lyase family protein n=1 Tax=Sulfitobacter dubius TaxID=218673 RepID=UPI0022AE6ABC|nr:CoA ester lyase [Sulfitobacter dubius]MCZ4368692.1 CoA ester lyase [Sulfitobacter dubius]